MCFCSLVRFEKNSKMPEEQNISDMIQENVVEVRAPRSSESLPSGNPACHTSSPQPPNLPVAAETIPPSEHLEQTSSSVQSSVAGKSQHRDVEIEPSSLNPVPSQLVTPPYQAETVA